MPTWHMRKSLDDVDKLELLFAPPSVLIDVVMKNFPPGRHSRESGNPLCSDASVKMDSRFRGNDGREGGHTFMDLLMRTGQLVKLVSKPSTPK
ncbi:hypothetical protein GCM10007901_04860 [Dyella acidisoli]|uniref:Uncharacterized protein n=1 Tax=Dyella acidisoli TaxID=1867834 RepID=A0ABQ5XLU2_9GAMM|nr:hypothetical protein GCM10007901_04860 [Dyella acidisoli]